MKNIYHKISEALLLDRNGEVLFPKKYSGKSDRLFPMVAELYLWDKARQLNSAEKYKDNIKRVFDPDKESARVKNMLQDDLRRMELVCGFYYGKRILEVGCSDGSVSIKIAQKPEVAEVVGIDIRKSAIRDGKMLIKKLLKQKEIGTKTANKVKLVQLGIEEIPAGWPRFDSVCAYEVFEHMAPQDFLPAFQHLYGFIKPQGKFFISVPNRFPNAKYEKLGRSRWKWFDHRNFFSQLSLLAFLSNFFKTVKFYPLYPSEKVSDSIYLIAECYGKKY